jgi:hypothetical protein
MMTVKSIFTVIKEGTLCLVHRLNTVISIATMGALLAALSYLLQIYFKLPNGLIVDMVLNFVCIILPLELYFGPRFLMVCDAELGHNPINKLSDWKVKFEERWLRAALVKILVSVTAGIGLGLMVVPGILILFAFSWMPLRVLLRGETISQAAIGSLATMSRYWKEVTPVIIAVGFIYLILLQIPLSLITVFAKAETIHARLVSPIVWVSNGLGIFINLWFSTCFLVIYNKLEKAMADDEQGDSHKEDNDN